MASQVHLISGLPRSGSTLLCAILRQNPRFVTAMTSPVISLFDALMPKMSGGSEFAVFFDDERRRSILRGVFDAYYSAVRPEQVVFDSNRTWTARTALVRTLFPEARLICCVRDVGWILDSIERMLRQNPLQLSRMFKFQPGGTVYSRIELLMNSETGLVGLAWSSLREAWFSDEAKRLIVVPYDSLVRQPQATVARLYEALREPFFQHDFDHVSYDEPDYDVALGMPGLHKVQPRVEFRPRDPCIPPDVFLKYADACFWSKPALNQRGVTIL